MLEVLLGEMYSQSSTILKHIKSTWGEIPADSVFQNSIKGHNMLRDRKTLLEQELKKSQTEAANMYLSIAVGGDTLHDKEYQALKEKISDLNFDLNAVNMLIAQGHK